MKARIPKSWESLPEGEKKIINEYFTDELNKALEKQEVELQHTWLKLACLLLHSAFKFGKSRCYMFLGNWMRIYYANARCKTAAEQSEWLDKEMTALFGKDGYPEQFVTSLENIGREKEK